MRILIYPDTVKVWLSARDTYEWARKPGEAWPCSELSGKRLFAEFDSNGLLDMAVNGNNTTDVDANELNAITSDVLRKKLPKDHPAYFVAVGQF